MFKLFMTKLLYAWFNLGFERRGITLNDMGWEETGLG